MTDPVVGIGFRHWAGNDKVELAVGTGWGGSQHSAIVLDRAGLLRLAGEALLHYTILTADNPTAFHYSKMRAGFLSFAEDLERVIGNAVAGLLVPTVDDPQESPKDPESEDALEPDDEVVHAPERTAEEEFAASVSDVDAGVGGHGVGDESGTTYEERHGLAVQCTVCHSMPGQRCRSTGKKLTDIPHAKRAADARKVRLGD